MITVGVFAQQSESLELKLSNNLVYSADELSLKNDFNNAEANYRRAISKSRDNYVASFNLGNTYFENENYEEALYRFQETIDNSDSKLEKHKAFHNIGNILMKQERCKEAVEAYKNALRFNPKDDETRYNFALAKECMENQSDKNKDDEGEDEENKDEKEENEKEQDKSDQDQQNEEGNDEEDNKNSDSDENQDGEDKEDDKGKPNDKEGDKEESNENKPKQPQRGQGKLSPQQIKNLLEAMNNQEQKVQKKINKENQKGVKVKTDKDW